AEFGAQLARRLAPSLQEYLLLLPSMEFLGSRSVRITPTNATSTQPDFIPVLNMFPLSNWSTRHIMFYSLLYAALFLIGLCGNVSVITLIRHVHATIPYDNTMIFILFLCCVDLASVIPLPMAIVDQLLGFW
uniref:G-protein coupled receptors family 1 profile domain-containing protein n=1 Tax=Parascaris univalens TaxID=6257 RepID=A0A915A7P4_PARUN